MASNNRFLPAAEAEGIRSYRANMVNESGNTVGLLELRVEQSRLDELLQATQVEDVIEDIRLMDTVHVVAVEDSKDHPVTASLILASLPQTYHKPGIPDQEDHTLKKIKSIAANERIQTYVCFAFLLFMMVFNLMHSALWADEWVEYYYSQKSIRTGDIFRAIVSTFQPPLYNLVMHFWLKISQSLLWFRLFNVVIGFIAGIFIYKTIQLLYTKRAAIISVFILATCYQWVYCIQECSEYSLMLACLCASIYFYVSCSVKFDYFPFFGFILFSVLAIYSQYGSVFVTIPLLALFFFKTVFDKQAQPRRKLFVLGSYVISLVIFALPLYLLFLKKQMENNAITGNTVDFSSDVIKDFPFVFGQITGYLFNANSGEIWPVVFSVISIIILALCLFIVADCKVEWQKKSIIIALLSGYTLHFFLVQMHIYAMVHPGESAGFFARYSYFYIPLCVVAFPIIIAESRRKTTALTSWKQYAAAGLAAWVLIVSFVGIMKNWHKSYDNVFIKTWAENEGWNEPTYLFGVKYGFYYYVKQLDNYEESFLDNVSESVDEDNLPDRFWAWRINWGGSGWKTTIDKARSLGYEVKMYGDHGYRGQLAYCELKE